MFLFLEATHVRADVLQVRLLVVAGNHVVRAIALVGSDVVGVVDGGKRMEVLHVRVHHLLEVVVVHGGALHGVTQVHRADIPTTNHQVHGVHQRQQVLEGHVQVASGHRSHLHRRALGNGAVEVGVHLALLRMPGNLVLVRENTGSDGRSVVATPTDQHHTDLGNASVRLEGVLLVLRSNNHLSVLDLGRARMVDVVGNDGVIRVGDIRSVNLNRRISILVSRIHYKSWF